MREQSYLNSKPPDPDSAPVELVLADVAALIDATSTCYIFSEVRERKLADTKRYALGLVILLAVVSSLIGFALRGSREVIFEPIILLGALGGAVSFVRRVDAIEPKSIYDVDPAVELATIDGARWAGFVAIALGAIFAMLLYVLFASGMLSGAALPRP